MTAEEISWWVRLAVAAVGFLMGLLYAFSGFRDTGKAVGLKDNPRVTNLRWLAVGRIAALFGD